MIETNPNAEKIKSHRSEIVSECGQALITLELSYWEFAKTYRVHSRVTGFTHEGYSFAANGRSKCSIAKALADAIGKLGLPTEATKNVRETVENLGHALGHANFTYRIGC